MNPSATTNRRQFSIYIDELSQKLDHLFNERADFDGISLTRGVPPFIFNEIQRSAPLAYSIPVEYGGKGAHPRETLSILEVCGYQSLALALVMGINGALFLEPLAKYGPHALKERVFQRFVHERSMGGLMITEPDFGTNALAMETCHTETATGFAIKGTKHWAGLSGAADFWLMTARKRTDGGLARDIDFFVCDAGVPGQVVKVKEFYNNLGLFMIPYGLNDVDVEVPADNRLQPETTGVRLLMDLLHRSRMRFAGMAMGYVRRILDEAIEHCRRRHVGGMPLTSFDQVQKRLAQLQAWFTTCSAFCKYSSQWSGIDKDLTDQGLMANIHKALMSDVMHGAGQSFLQLVGAKGYRHDHIAGRAFIDSRPFQIFEGSNDVIYSQIGDSVLKLMRKAKETNLGRFLATTSFASRAAEICRKHLDFRVDKSLPQRRRVELGKVISRTTAIDLVIDLSDGGFNQRLADNAIDLIGEEIVGLVATCMSMSDRNVIEDYRFNDHWQECLS